MFSTHSTSLGEMESTVMATKPDASRRKSRPEGENFSVLCQTEGVEVVASLIANPSTALAIHPATITAAAISRGHRKETRKKTPTY